MPQKVVISGANADGTSSTIKAEEFLDLIGTADLADMAVSMGWYYSTGHFDDSVGNNSSVDILIRTGSDLDMLAGMFDGVLSSGGDALLEVFQGPTLTSDGTPLTLLQLNQLSTNTPKSLAFHTPTITDPGTRLFPLFIPGGSGGVAIGGTSSPFQRLIALPGTDYLIRGTNIAGNAKSMGMTVNVIEVPPSEEVTSL